MSRYEVSIVEYNTEYKVIGNHIDGRIFAVKLDGSNGLYVVDRNLNLVTTLNETLPNSVLNGVNECRILNSGIMIVWGIYQYTPLTTKIYRSTDTSFSSFEVAIEMRSDTCLIEKSLDVSTEDDTIMFCEYTMKPKANGLWTEPTTLYVYKSSDSGLTWNTVFSQSRIPLFDGDTDFIRHFHSIRYDRYINKFWITSGDAGDECAMWTISADGTNADIKFRHSGDGQIYRTTSLMFEDGYVHWGSDSPLASGYGFMKYNRLTEEITKLQKPNDAIRITDKLNTIFGDLLIGQKSYEGNVGNEEATAEMFLYSEEENAWYPVIKFTAINTSTSDYAMIFQMISNFDNRLFLTATRIKDVNNVNRSVVTLILDLAIKKMNISPLSALIKNNEDIQFSVTNSFLQDISGNVSWYSSNPSIGVITSGGLFSAKSTGVVRLICIDTLYGGYSSVWVTIMDSTASNNGAVKINISDIEAITIPIYDVADDPYNKALRLRVQTEEAEAKAFKINALVQSSKIPILKINTEEGIREITSFE